MGDRFVAVGARPARADTAAEQVAVGAAAGVEVALLAGAAFVDDRGAGLRVGWWRARGEVAVAVGGLAAGVGAVAAPTGGVVSVSALLADHPRIITTIVTHGRVQLVGQHNGRRSGKWISKMLRTCFQPKVPVPAVPPRVVVRSRAMRRSSLSAESSSGKWPLVLDALRIW